MLLGTLLVLASALVASGAGAAFGLAVFVAAAVSLVKALTPFGIKPAALLASGAAAYRQVRRRPTG